MAEPVNNFGTDGDHCPECGHDWKAPHDVECSQFHQCEYPPGCEEDARFGSRLCLKHFRQVSALLFARSPDAVPLHTSHTPPTN